MKIENNSKHTIRIMMVGTEKKEVTLRPGKSENVDLDAGAYVQTVAATYDKKKIKPYFAKMNLRPFCQYSQNFIVNSSRFEPGIK